MYEWYCRIAVYGRAYITYKICGTSATPVTIECYPMVDDRATNQHILITTIGTGVDFLCMSDPDLRNPRWSTCTWPPIYEVSQLPKS
jgi:hypothetical protein